MKVMKVLFRAAMRVATLVLVPSAVLAQGSITGSVRDTTNAVLPGVTRPMALGFKTEEIQRTIAIGAEGSL